MTYNHLNYVIISHRICSHINYMIISYKMYNNKNQSWPWVNESWANGSSGSKDIGYFSKVFEWVTFSWWVNGSWVMAFNPPTHH